MLSVVIPALDAAGSIGPCLDSAAEADEVVVVDGGSRDDTAALAEQRGARVIHSPPGRGVQLVAGAAAARGDWLVFLHADTVLAPGWRSSADRHIERHPAKAACFRFRLDAREWEARLVEAAVALRVRLFALPYGDQGLIVPRSLYESIGGYRPLPLMEDVDLVRRLGRARLTELDAEAQTGADRWRRDGWFRRSARNLFCLGLYAVGVPPIRLARLYNGSRDPVSTAAAAVP